MFDVVFTDIRYDLTPYRSTHMGMVQVYSTVQYQ